MWNNAETDPLTIQNLVILHENAQEKCKYILPFLNTIYLTSCAFLWIKVQSVQESI